MFAVLGAATAIDARSRPTTTRRNAKVAVIDYACGRARRPRPAGYRAEDLARSPAAHHRGADERFRPSKFQPRGDGRNFEPASVLLPIAFYAARRQGWGSMYKQTRSSSEVPRPNKKATRNRSGRTSKAAGETETERHLFSSTIRGHGGQGPNTGTIRADGFDENLVFVRWRNSSMKSVTRAEAIVKGVRIFVAVGR